MAPHLIKSAAAAAAVPGGVGSTALVLCDRLPGCRPQQAAPAGPAAGAISRPRRSSRPSVRPSFLVPRDDAQESAQRKAAMAPHLIKSAAAAAVDPGGVGSTALALVADPAEDKQCGQWCGQCGQCGLRGEPVGHRSRFACRTKQRARYDYGTPDGRRPPNRRPLPSPGGPTRVVCRPRRSARLLMKVHVALCKAALKAKEEDQEGA